MAFGSKVPPQTVRISNPRFRIPTWAWAAGIILKGLKDLIVWLARRYWVTGPLLAAVLLWWWTNLYVVAGVEVLLVVGLIVWREKHPHSFGKLSRFYQGKALQTASYRDWGTLAAACGLNGRVDGRIYTPQIVSVSREVWGDRVLVKMLPGQHPDHYARVAGNMAHHWKVLGVSAFSPANRADHVMLLVKRNDLLAQLLQPLPRPEYASFRALPVAYTEWGKTYPVDLSQHAVVIGATGAGKGSAIWSVLHALAPSIAAGLVQVHAFDPKGGMELAFGAPLFHAFHHGDAASMIAALEDLVKIMDRRADRYRGQTRDHVQSITEPTILIIIDEFADLAAFTGDKKLRELFQVTMSKILNKGRATGFGVLGALQDPRKDVLGMRHLFATRIGMRLNEPDDTELVFGRGAIDRGAACHRIPRSMPGMAYVVMDDNPNPARVRFAYFDNDQILQMAAEYPALWTGGEVQ